MYYTWPNDNVYSYTSSRLLIVNRQFLTLHKTHQLQDVWDPKYLHRDELYLILCRFLQTIYLKYVH